MKKIIATVGPSLLYTTSINEVHSDQIIYRINGAHGTISEIESYILEIKSQVKNATILMDLPGNKVRTKGFDNGYIDIIEGEKFSLFFEQMNYTNLYKHIKVNDIVWANDSIFKFTVSEITKDKIIFISHSTGQLKNNKGIHIRGIHSNIPFLFEKDTELIKLANKYKLAYVGLSFVRTKQDVILAKHAFSESTCKSTH